MNSYKRGMTAFAVLLSSFSVKGQTLVTSPMSSPVAAGSYYSPTSITLSPGFSFTAGAGQSLNLYISTCEPLNAALSADQNYVLTRVPRIAGVRDESGLSNRSVCDLMETVQYIDGLGRPLQTVQVKGSPGLRDLVQPFAYDQFGREAQKYLPYTAVPSASAGAYKFGALADQASFYAAPSGSSWNAPGVVTMPLVNGLSPASSQALFEASPLNRVLEQGAPGNDWQLSSGHTVKLVYGTNNVLPLSDTSNSRIVALYSISAIDAATQQRTLSRNGNYNAGELYVTVNKDENWVSGRGGTTEEYKDKEGRVVLKRAFNAPPGSSSVLQTLSTYYVYDDLGNLAYVLPPGSNADGSLPTQTMLDNLCYQYRYDERNRLTQKKLPGKGWEYMVYNKLDQPVMSQDANQRLSNQWTVTKYDALGRVIMTGLWNAGSVVALSTLQNNIYTQSQWDSADGSAITGYTNLCYPTTPLVLLSVNYYDGYTNIPGMPGSYQPAAGTYSGMTKGLLTATKTAVLNTIGNALPDYLWSVNYYDDNGRNIRTYQQHYLGGMVNVNNYDEISNTYNFNDQVTGTIRKHYTNTGTAGLKLTITNENSYDHMGRLLKTWQQMQNRGQAADTRTLLVKNDYNEIGQLLDKNLHSTDSTNFLQTVTYRYNERGWLQLASAPLFAYQLYYNTGTRKAYNGNIMYQYWGTAGNLGTNYSYEYDQLNRLRRGTSNIGNHENNLTYDLMGNIQSLDRYRAYTKIDQLNYVYNGSHRLESVTDAIAGSEGQKGGMSSYDYDQNGNLIKDTGKGITNIVYNMLNLPQTITGKNTTYTYDATGRKLRRIVGAATTDYVGGIQYEGSTGGTPAVSFIQTGEGRVLPMGASAYSYEYTLADHLGNSRVSFDRNPSGGTARQVQADDYYPFGMAVNKTVNGLKNNYLYNNKELQEDLGQYDYGARFYDPEIARWTSVDPLAEISRRWTPYGYGENNPIRNIDVDGMWTEDKNGVHSDNAAEAQAFFTQLQNSLGGPGDKDKKKKEPEKKNSFFSELTKHYTGPLEATMTSEQRAQYFKESAKGAAWIMGGEALSLLRIGRLFPWMGRLLGLTGDAAAVEINVEQFANEIIQINKTTEGGGILLSGTPESAINSALYYEKPVEQGAAIYRSIISNHMFIDGNKRTAVLVLEAFAKKMGVKVASESQLLNVATKVATEHLDVTHIVKLISK